MRAFPVRLPSGVRYWTVVDEDFVVVPSADAFLRHVRFGRDQAELRITTLEQQVVDLELKLQDRGDDLAAARAANRELMAQLNRGRDAPLHPG